MPHLALLDPPAERAPLYTEERIGHSADGRPLTVIQLGPSTARRRVYLMAGQHGDERLANRVLTEWVKRLQITPFPEDLCVAVLACANPDGYASRSRCNAQGLDLNRDHLHLEAPETQAIHSFLKRWRPSIVVDIHNFPSRRRALVENNCRLAWDLCLDVPTVPAAAYSEQHPVISGLLREFVGAMRECGYVTGRYTLVDSRNRARHSTPRLVDARNVLALRFEIPVLLVEIRNPSRQHGTADRSQLEAAGQAALEFLLNWFYRESGAQSFNQPRPHALALSYRRRATAHAHTLPVVDLTSNEVSAWPLAQHRPTIEPRRSRPLPRAFVVPKSEQRAITLLDRHGFQYERICSEPAPCHIYPVAQTGGPLLTLLLDAESRFRLSSVRALAL